MTDSFTDSNDINLFCVYRFDLRPFLYRVNWPWQFAKIDREEKKATNQLAQIAKSLDCPPLIDDNGASVAFAANLTLHESIDGN